MDLNGISIADLPSLSFHLGLFNPHNNPPHSNPHIYTPGQAATSDLCLHDSQHRNMFDLFW